MLKPIVCETSARAKRLGAKRLGANQLVGGETTPIGWKYMGYWLPGHRFTEINGFGKSSSLDRKPIKNWVKYSGYFRFLLRKFTICQGVTSMTNFENSTFLVVFEWRRLLNGCCESFSFYRDWVYTGARIVNKRVYLFSDYLVTFAPNMFRTIGSRHV